MTNNQTLGNLYDLTVQYVWDKAKDGEKSWKQAEVVCELIPAFDWKSHTVKGICQADLLQAADTLTRQGKSPATVNRYMAALSRMLTLAEELGWIKDRPKWKPLKEGKKVRTVLTREMEEQLDRHLSGAALACFRVLLGTALRPDELFDIESRWTMDGIFVKDAKNGDDRKVPTEAVAPGYLMEADREIRGGFNYRSFLAKFNYAKRKANLDDIQGLSPYSLRHTAITRLIRAGVPLPVVQKWAGHKSINTTLTYVHMDQSDLESAARKLKAYNDGQAELDRAVDLLTK